MITELSKKLINTIYNLSIMNIAPLDEKYYDDVLKIADDLRIDEEGGGWFTDKAVDETIPVDVKIQRGFVSKVDGKVVGFITYFSGYGIPKIGWMAVKPEYHRRGIGRSLLIKVEGAVGKAGADSIKVETSTEEEGIGTGYESTYKFYKAMGFEVDEIFEGETCDMALLKKRLSQRSESDNERE